MKSNLLTKTLQIAKSLVLPLLASLAITSCGGSGGGGDDSPITTRPKTLDNIVLTLDSNVTFEFIRNTGSAPAISTGETETGTFFYTHGGLQLRQYPNQGGTTSDTRYPDSISNASYTYQAMNETSGLLTLIGFGINDLVTTGGLNANNGSFTYLFNSDSSSNVINRVEIDLTFTNTGAAAVTGVNTLRIPGSTQPGYDVIRVPMAARLTNGAVVPPNYNPTVDPNRPSRITPASLGQLLLQFTNGIPDPNFNFTISFVRDSEITLNNVSTEIGQGFLRVAGNPIQNAINYTWTRIGGSDSGTLVISNSNLTFDGTYRVDFSGKDNGRYAGAVDGNTPDAMQVTGTFFIPGIE